MNIKMSLSNNNISKNMIRIGLGIFFLVFGLLKFVATDWFIAGPYKGFYGIAFPTALLWFMGLVQLAIAFSFFMNVHTKWAAWIASAMLLSTIIATFPKIVTTFSLPPAEAPPGFLFFAVVPLLFMALSEALKEEEESSHHEETRHEEIHQEEIHQEETRHEEIHQEETKSPQEGTKVHQEQQEETTVNEGDKQTQ